MALDHAYLVGERTERLTHAARAERGEDEGWLDEAAMDVLPQLPELFEVPHALVVLVDGRFRRHREARPEHVRLDELVPHRPV